MPSKGDIVLVSFPFTDMAGEKRRPALVLGTSGEHAILVFITSKSTGEARWRVPLVASAQTGLSVSSVVRCDKITSLDLRVLTGRLGVAPASTRKAVDTKLKRLLDL